VSNTFEIEVNDLNVFDVAHIYSPFGLLNFRNYKL
jgi:hypothetical protein